MQLPYPRVLVVSINPFSKCESNGKVLAQLFKNWNSDCLAQFYVYNEIPDSSACKNYYRITDIEALKSLTTFKKYGGKIAPSNKNTPIQCNDIVTRPFKKNAFTCLMRDLVWNCGAWKTKTFYEWVDCFKPELIFVMAGGSSFIHNIALSLSKKYDIPLVVYNTEKYYFLNRNYLKGRGGEIFYPIYHAECRFAFRRMMKRSSLEIYCNDTLRQIYNKEFGKNSEVIYLPTCVSTVPAFSDSTPKVFSYIGTLGYKRAESLLQIGKALKKISADYCLDVYGRSPDKKTYNILMQSPGIRYHGFIDSEKVSETIKKTDLLFHAESFDPDILPLLQTGFSSKIPDCLASGKCLVLYADRSISCTQYLLENDCALVITAHDELENGLRKIISDSDLRNYYIKNAVEIVRKNHNADMNCSLLRDFLANCLYKNKN